MNYTPTGQPFGAQVPDRRGPRQVPMFRTKDRFGVGYFAKYDEEATPETWEGDEPYPKGPMDHLPSPTRSVFGGIPPYREEGTEEHRVFRANRGHRETVETMQGKGELLGHDVPPKVPHPKMTWGELQKESEWADADGPEFGEDVTWRTPEGSAVAHAYLEEDEFGPLVKTAEIAEEYQGRNWSREMMGDIAEDYGGRGIIHSDGFTPQGEKAFAKKGVPDDLSLEHDANRYGKMQAQQEEMIGGLLQSLGRRRPGDSHGPRYTQDRIAL